MRSLTSTRRSVRSESRRAGGGYTGITLPSYGNDIHLEPLAQLWNEQAGYRWNSHTKEPTEQWPDEWLVIA